MPSGSGSLSSNPWRDLSWVSQCCSFRWTAVRLRVGTNIGNPATHHSFVSRELCPPLVSWKLPLVVLSSASKSQRSHELRKDVSGGRQRHRDLATHSTSSSHVSSSESPDLRRAATVEGDRAVFSGIMQIITSAVRDLWIAEGVTSVDDLACLYTTPRQICHHVDEHNLEDAHIDSSVQGWTLAKKWVCSWRRYNTRRRKRTELSPSPAENNQVLKSCRFGKICVNGVPRSSDSPIPT